MLKVRIKKIDKDAVLPNYAHTGDAAMDFYALKKVALKPGERFAVSTGIQMEIPEGYVGLIWDKSGIGIKEGIKTLGGVVDSGYRGEVLIGVVNLSEKEYFFEKGHKVAQMIIQKKEEVKIEEVEILDEKTSRGKKGFGSTGK